LGRRPARLWSKGNTQRQEGLHRPIPLDRFACSSIERSSFIRRVCYDGADAYMVVQLNDTYYHYCDIDKATIDAFLGADSMGRFYNAAIKSRFDCRTGNVPNLQ